MPANASPRRKWRLQLLLLALVATGIYLAGLGRLPLFGRDEALYAEAAREMLVSGDWVTPRVNGEFFFEKPPLLYWLSAVTYPATGIVPLGARLAGAIMAMATILLIAATTARLWGRRAGFLAGLSLATCLLFAVVGRLGIMDAPLAFLTTVALITYARWRSRGGLLPGLVFGGLLGLGMLLKGLAGGLPAAIALVHLAAHKSRPARVSAGSVVVAIIAVAMVAAPWYTAMFMRHGQAFYHVFVEQQHGLRMAQAMQAHGGPCYYYLALLTFAFFPWVVFLPSAVRRAEGESDEQTFWRSLALVWFLVILIPFSLVKTKLPGYIVPLLPAAALLAGIGLDRCLDRPRRWPWFVVAVMGTTFGIAITLLPLLAMRLGERYNASTDAGRLVIPAAVWAGGYAVSFLAAVHLGRPPRHIINLFTLASLTAVAALLWGLLPILSPYLGGGPAELARFARQRLPSHRIVLYETHPEAVAFVLQRPVPTYSHNQQAELLNALQQEPTALIAPRKEELFLRQLPFGQQWSRGLQVMLEVPRVVGNIPVDNNNEMGRSQER